MSEEIMLREVEHGDLPIFFAQQLDPEANYIAAFTAKNPADEAAFMTHWARIMADEGIIIRTILFMGQVAGFVLTHDWFGEPEVSYWLGKEFWGQGIATRALSAFLQEVNTRPLTARAAKDNIGSVRVLQKCGFQITGEDKGFANARGREVEEYIFTLPGSDSEG